ncbi:MAG: 3'-5' exonuclease, partial [Acidobacteriota bacterium]
MSTRTLAAAASAEDRLRAARRWLEDALGEANEALILASSRGAADDLLRLSCRAGGGLFGVHRSTIRQLAAELATPAMAQTGLAPVSGLGIEALAARAISLCAAGQELKYFAPVAEAPGLARALASTLQELRANGVDGNMLQATGAPGADLDRLLGRYEEELDRWALADDAKLYQLARYEIEHGDHVLLGLPVLILDPTPRHRAERRFLAALVQRTPAAFATLVHGDQPGEAALEEILGVQATYVDGPAAHERKNKLERLRRRVFAAAGATDDEPSDRPDEDTSFELISAAGEGRECVEIARRIHALAHSGIGFDHIAILLRDPGTYLPLVEEALRRAGIPAYFTRGTIRPDPAGRALLALLDCKTEGLSASRFAEYLSLGQVPLLDDTGAPPAAEVPWVAPEGDQLVFKTLLEPEEVAQLAPEPGIGEAEPNESDDAPVIAGTLRTPRGWERLLVDARVFGGRERWRERLAGLAAELRLQLRDLAGEDAARAQSLRARLERLGHLERFALPVIDKLDELPSAALWGEWLGAIEALASQVLRQPERVLTVLAELRPMDRVGPVTLDEVRRVLGQRLSAIRLEPPARRYGRVFVATIDEARGLSFEAVFVPGLAEGIFPRRALEDPLLLDTYRRQLDAPLATQDERVVNERLLLRIAAGAARSRLIVSYPNLDMLQGR